jgi:hypothetical protein
VRISLNLSPSPLKYTCLAIVVSHHVFYLPVLLLASSSSLYFSLDSLYLLVGLLREHVIVVNHNQLVSLAIQKDQKRREGEMSIMLEDMSIEREEEERMMKGDTHLASE